MEELKWQKIGRRGPAPPGSNSGGGPQLHGERSFEQILLGLAKGEVSGGP